MERFYFKNIKATICSDDYKYYSQVLSCPYNNFIQVLEVNQIFNQKGQFPYCDTDGYKYSSYPTPFIKECDTLETCVISQSFIDRFKLFSAIYVLPDSQLYPIPFRIDIFYECKSSNNI